MANTRRKRWILGGVAVAALAVGGYGSWYLAARASLNEALNLLRRKDGRAAPSEAAVREFAGQTAGWRKREEAWPRTWLYGLNEWSELLEMRWRRHFREADALTEEYAAAAAMGEFPVVREPRDPDAAAAHLPAVRGAAQFLLSRFRLAAASGRAGEAMLDWRLVRRLAGSFGKEPFLANARVAVAIAADRASALAAVAAAGELGCFSDAELRELAPEAEEELRLAEVVGAGIAGETVAVFSAAKRGSPAEIMAQADDVRGAFGLIGQVLQGIAAEGEPADSADFRAASAYWRSLAQSRAARAALAVELYRRASGEWPESLSALVPEYLDWVPLDPFDSRPLSYRVGEGGVLLSREFATDPYEVAPVAGGFRVPGPLWGRAFGPAASEVETTLEPVSAAWIYSIGPDRIDSRGLGSKVEAHGDIVFAVIAGEW